MRKLFVLLVLGGFVMTSCQKDELSAYVNPDSTALKAKVNQSTTIEEESEAEDGCPTAFGRYCECANQNTCFSDFGISRWGWSVELNSYRTYRFNLFAGAGQCDLDKGMYVGYVNVKFKNDGTVSYGTPVILEGHTMTEFHFYSGETEMPLKKNGDMTAAPGQFVNEGDVDGDGKVYVIVHATVCEASAE